MLIVFDSFSLILRFWKQKKQKCLVVYYSKYTEFVSIIKVNVCVV